MKILVKEAILNGNNNGNAVHEHFSRGYSDSLNWEDNHNVRSDVYDNYNISNITENITNYITNNSINVNNEIGTEIILDNVTESSNITLAPNENYRLVYNRQYRLNNIEDNKTLVEPEDQSQTAILETLTETVYSPCDSYQANINVSLQKPINNEEQAFELFDTDEVSENGSQQSRVPRGIVNPNYPGFQHFADTLQDYSSNIENFYQSENDMTDDDIDVDIADCSYDNSLNHTTNNLEDLNANNNNNNCNEAIENFSQHITGGTTTAILTENGKEFQNNVSEIPDLLKNISKLNNNNEESTYLELTPSDSDIEINFHTKNIIGNFNKEIEYEIKQLLNYNINVEDDLEELRKDIKDTFSKPIENTINNISEVVNHVIKKLVETKSDSKSDINHEGFHSEPIKTDTNLEIKSNVYLDNETNAKTEMKLNRPTFLLIENSGGNKISDAWLSDATDELNLYEGEYDIEKISSAFENTINNLNTELNKIIPQVKDGNGDCNNEAISTDDNSNELPNKSISTSVNLHSTKELFKDANIVKENNSEPSSRRPKCKRKIVQTRERKTDMVQPSVSSTSGAQTSISVRKTSSEDDSDLESFDVYNIETAMPALDIDAIENHLKAAKEAERRKRNDREEIRRRLAMGADNDEYYSMGHIDRPGKKPSLHSRLQSGKNLQICFMNETASDNESQSSDVEKNTNNSSKPLMKSSIFSKSNYSLNNHPYQTKPLSVNITKHDRLSSMQSAPKLRPSTLNLRTTKSRSSHSIGHVPLKESDFRALQATLQTEARIALAQAKEMARLQMERERRSRAVSPVTAMLRTSMEKANAPLAADRRRVSRQLLTDMNIAQLQVIVNELHSQIEALNDALVTLLMARDDLHMGQDSMLVDIEDLTRYLGVKEQTKKTKGNTKTGMKRFTSFVHK